MKGIITHHALCNRCHMTQFTQYFYSKYAKSSTQDNRLFYTNLGRSWSGFVYHRDSKNYLVLFDNDDGSGGTPADCKLQWHPFQKVISEHQISDYIIFKAQCGNLPEQKQHYPFHWDVYPTGIMSDDPRIIHEKSKTFKTVNNPQIDVLFVGGRVHENNLPYCWPKNRNLNQWWVGNRKIGYEKLLKIKESRKDLNIMAIDNLLPNESYYDVVANSKICLDFPGVGQSSRKFFEFLVLGKCVLSLMQQPTCWELREDKHYASLGHDFNYEMLELRINQLLSTGEWSQIARNTQEIKHKLTHEFVGDYVISTVDKHIDNKIINPDYRVVYR